MGLLSLRLTLSLVCVSSTLFRLGSVQEKRTARSTTAICNSLKRTNLDCGISPQIAAAEKIMHPQGLHRSRLQPYTFVFCALMVLTGLTNIACHFGTNSFDFTLGFPGEGPPHAMTFATANIGSIQSNHDWKSWGNDVICLQETRIGKNKQRSAVHAIHDAGYGVVLGHILPGLLRKVGRLHTPCGGTAVLAPPHQIKPFLASDDETGLYTRIFNTKRVACAWVQIAKKRQALVLSVYATTGASTDQKIHDENNALFSDLFQLAAQFGSIPIMIAGDFQASPMSYSAISEALHLHNWFDPLAVVNQEGDLQRPLTFSNDGLFSGHGEGCTSIDGFLLNQPAFFALESCRVMELFGRQRRPVECSFSWESLDVIGYTLYKTAAFDLKDVPKPVWDPRWNLSPEHDRPHTFDEWDSRWERRFAETQDSDLRWQVINQFCIHELKACGGVWGEGPQLRAQPPTFIPKQVCPPQHRNHCAATRTSSIMHKLQRQLDELFLRRARGFSSDQDRHIFRVTACKLQKRLRTLSMPFVWPHHELITLVHIQQAKKWVLSEIESHFKRLKTDRIQKWKQRIQHSASHGCGYIFEHLRNRLQDEPANLVEDDLGNILYQPECALKHLNSKWDDVYAANVLHDHPLQMLKTIWPYIHDKSTQANLPPIDADVLFRTVHKRKTAAAPGLDGWRTCELQALPSHCFAPIARFFRWIEQNPQIPLPEALTCSKQVILNKPGPSSAMNKRLITILPALWLSYTGARFEQLQTWQIVSMPNCIIGGVKGRTMPELHTALRLDIDVARDRKQELIGIKLDKAKCFDRLIPAFTASLFLAFGLPAFFVSVFLRMYDSLRRHIAYKGWINPISTTAPNGVVQGCSISLIAVNVHTKVWVHLLELLPDLSMRAFVDDAYIWCHLQRIDVLSRAIELTRLWDELNGRN